MSQLFQDNFSDDITQAYNRNKELASLLRSFTFFNIIVHTVLYHLKILIELYISGKIYFGLL